MSGWELPALAALGLVLLVALILVFAGSAKREAKGKAVAKDDLKESEAVVAQQVIPGMVERGEGHLVQTISSASLITGPSGMGYTLTKHGALGFAEWVALNYMHLGVVVTCLCPNAVNTGMLGRNEDDEEAAGRSDNAVIANIGEIVEPEVCADMTVDAMRDGRFLVLPHPRVGESFARKASDYDRWLEGTNRRLRRMRGEDV